MVTKRLQIHPDVARQISAAVEKVLRDSESLPVRNRVIVCLSEHLRYPGDPGVSVEEGEDFSDSENLYMLFSLNPTNSFRRWVEVTGEKKYLVERLNIILQKRGICTLYDLVIRKEKGDLALIDGVGRAALKKIKDWLAALGLSLGMQLDEKFRPTPRLS